MTDRSYAQQAGPVPDAVFEEAAIWQARMRDDDADRAAFERWLAADPRHHDAYREAERLLAAIGAVEKPQAEGRIDVRGRVRPATAWRRVRRAVAGIAIAASVAVLLGTGWAWHGVLLDRIRSDYATATGERTTLDLADGSRVVLGSDTALAVDFQDRSTRRVRLFRGEAWFEVSRNAARPFVVETDTGSIRVLGTRFDVRIEEDSAQVSLAEGLVELRKGPGTAAPAVTLRPGQQARLAPGGISAPRRFSADQVSAWRRGQMVFYETPLSEVVAQLNRYRPGHIAIMSPALERLKVTGVFRTDDPGAVIAAIEDALPVRVQRLTGNLVLLR